MRTACRSVCTIGIAIIHVCGFLAVLGRWIRESILRAWPPLGIGIDTGSVGCKPGCRGQAAV
eukprot:40580-Alexandrium_andersonii.AAC.1